MLIAIIRLLLLLFSFNKTWILLHSWLWAPERKIMWSSDLRVKTEIRMKKPKNLFFITEEVPLSKKNRGGGEEKEVWNFSHRRAWCKTFLFDTHIKYEELCCFHHISFFFFCLCPVLLTCVERGQIQWLKIMFICTIWLDAIYNTFS